jgi:hypothetical protein
MGRRRLGRATGPLVTAVGLALALLTAATMMPAVSARFTASTGNAGNTFTASASFCNSTTTVTAVADSETDEAAPTTNKGTSTQMYVAGSSSRRRSFVRFTLPTAPAGCTLGSATLDLTPVFGASGAAMSVYRVTSPWSETTITWNTASTMTTDPTPVNFTSASGGDSIAVLAMVQAMYSGTNNGFMLRQTNETINSYPYCTRESGSGTPQLVLTWT